MTLFPRDYDELRAGQAQVRAEQKKLGWTDAEFLQHVLDLAQEKDFLVYIEECLTDELHARGLLHEGDE